MLCRFAASYLLAAAVALLAPGAYVHVLTHLDEQLAHSHEKPDDATTHPQYECELCGAYAGSASGAAGTVQTPVFIATPDAETLAPVEPLLPSLALARFASRAPPAEY
jgi:hypothetical protein